MIEAAHEAATATVPTDQRGQLARAGNLRQAGADLTTLANACELATRLRNE